MGIKINVEPTQLEASANQIDNQCQMYENQYHQLYLIVDELSHVWKGKDNQTFTTQIKGFEADFVAMKKLMQEYALYLRKAAKSYRDTQNERAALARQLHN